MRDKQAKKAVLAVKIHSPSGTIWEGAADSVSSVNLKGPFDILPEHARFITVLEKQEIEVRIGQETKKFPVDRGVMSVIDNTVSVLTGL